MEFLSVLNTESDKSSNQNIYDKIKIKAEEITNKIQKGKKTKKYNKNIFNNKKNNALCSELLKAAMKNEKNLYLIPYPTKKQKINKTFDTIGDKNGISYPNLSVVNGILIGDKNYVNIIRDDDRKSMNLKMSKRLDRSLSKKNKNRISGNNFVKNKENSQDF